MPVTFIGRWVAVSGLGALKEAARRDDPAGPRDALNVETSIPKWFQFRNRNLRRAA